MSLVSSMLQLACIASAAVRRAFPLSGCAWIGARAKNWRSRGWWSEEGTLPYKPLDFEKPVCPQIRLPIGAVRPSWLKIPSLASPPTALLSFCSHSNLHTARMRKSSSYRNACYAGRTSVCTHCGWCGHQQNCQWWNQYLHFKWLVTQSKDIKISFSALWGS